MDAMETSEQMMEHFSWQTSHNGRFLAKFEITTTPTALYLPPEMQTLQPD
jgi:hypothetical protein